MQQPPPNLATTPQHPSYPPPQFPPHRNIFHPQHLSPPPTTRHPPIPAANSRYPIVHFVPNGLANDGQMIKSNLQHQQIRESAYLPPNMLYPNQNQFHHNGAQYLHPNDPVMECSEIAGPPPSSTTTVPYTQFACHHHYLPHPPAAVPPPNNANGAMMPPIPLPIPLVPFNMNMNSHITPAAMAAAHAHPPPPPHIPHPNPHPHIHPHHPPSISGQHHHLVTNNKRVTGPSPANGPNSNPIENNNNIGIAGPVDCWSTAVTGWEQAAMIKNKIGLVINGSFRIMQSIASGSYGEIFAAEDLHSHGPKHQRVAVKFDGACRDNHLRYEYEVYKSVLYEDGNGKVEGFPQVYSWSHEYGHNIMVMELLGAPVASLFAFCDRKFARQTIVSLGEQMIQRIRHLHQRGFIHRDIKPENFLMGLAGKESTLYLIDFGLARRYRFREGENRTLTHIPYRRGRSFIGTAKYASLNSHKNIELSRRDDLESLSYVLIELVNGHLPWKNISKRNATTRHQASQRIRQLKEQTNWDDFCPCLSKFIRYCREIHFNDEPDYDKLLDLLQMIAIPPAELSITLPSAISMRNAGKVKKIFASAAATVCCQTLETAEKMTQVNLEQQTTNEGKAELMQNENEKNISNDGEEVKQLANSIQSQLSLNTAENASDFDEIGAATTTTSCSENELEIGGGEKAITTRSGTGTADDEDSQPTPQQEQQQVCRKCRRHRDQNHQQQQKRVSNEQHHQQNPQQITTQRVNIHTQPPRVVDNGLQIDLQQQLPIIHLPLAMRQQKGESSTAEQKKMCWQRAREMNAERRFQYENKFSWTLPLQTAEPITMGAASTSKNHLIASHILTQQAPKVAGNMGILPPAAPAILPTHPPLATAVHYAGPITNGYIVQAPKQDHPIQQMGNPPLIPSTLLHPPSIQNTKQMPGTAAQFHAVNLRNPPPLPQINGSINSSSTTSASAAAVQKPIHLTSIPSPHPIFPEALQQRGGEGRTLQVAFVLPPPATHPTMQFN